MEARNKRVVISISVPAWLAEEIDREASAMNMSRSAVVRSRFLGTYINSYYKEEKRNGRKEE